MRHHLELTPEGRFRVWATPRPNGSYVIGADVAENRVRDRNTGPRKAIVQYTDDRPDYSAAIVLELNSGDHVASWHGWIDPDEFAITLAAMGDYYRQAHLVPEVNGPGLAVVDSLVKVVRYPNVYRSKIWCAETDDPVTSGYGWRTTQHSRPMLIQRIHEAANSGQLRTRDMDLINELRTMEFDESGVARGRGKNKDDRVLALGLALQGRFELLYGAVGEDPVDTQLARLDPYQRKVWEQARRRLDAAERRKKRGESGSSLGRRPHPVGASFSRPPDRGAFLRGPRPGGHRPRA